MFVRNVAVLGATGSIGQSTLEVIAASEGRLRAVALSAHHRLEELRRQAKQFVPRWVAATAKDRGLQFDWADLPTETELLLGEEGVQKIASDPSIDIVVAAIVGSAGLTGAWAAIEAGKTLALANKETLVVAGPLAMGLAEKTGAKILPVDSEHSAIFQAIQAGRRTDLKRIVLTASGGPFRGMSQKQLEQATVEQALAHPTWNMGPKITIDSATMMNKALEIIEARWLFNVDSSQIDVVVHPQSVVHSLVEFQDGAIVAQLSPPDMKLPIQYALSYPERWEGPAAKLDLTNPLQLDFEPPDEDRFPALRLGKEVARVGGTAGAVLNAANEAAVQGFLDQRLSFLDIVSACRAVLDNHPFDPAPTLEELMRLDRWARREIEKWISC